MTEASLSRPREPSVSVVIPARNAADTLARQLRALVAQEDAPPFEVVVVDDASSDDTADVARGFAGDLRLELMSLEQNAGPSIARNLGTETSQGELVLYCDADDAVFPNWVAEMASAASSADVLGGALVPDKDDGAASIAALFPAQREGLARAGYLWYAISANMACWREVINAIGGWDADLTHGEDVDFSLRAQNAGYRLGAAPAAKIRYAMRPTVRSLLRQRAGYGYGIGLLEQKHGLPARSLGTQLLAPLAHSVGLLRPRPSDRVARLALIATDLGRARAALDQAGARTPRRRYRFAASAILRSVPELSARALRRQTLQGGSGDRVPFTSAPGSPVSGLGMVAPSCDGARSPVAASYSRVPLEPLTVEWLASLLTPGDTAVDVGANIGLVSLVLSRLVGPTGHVLAIEPVPENVACLRENVRRHSAGAVEVLDIAVGCAVGRTTLEVGENTLIAREQRDRFRTRPATARSIEVLVEPLDDILGHLEPTVIKIDVEGGELQALRGARATLERSPGTRLVVELTPSCHGDGSGRALVELLDRLGFRHVLAEDDTASPRFGQVRQTQAAMADWDAGRLPPLWYANLLCSRDPADLPPCSQ